jgi:hypothetical protein
MEGGVGTDKLDKIIENLQALKKGLNLGPGTGALKGDAPPQRMKLDALLNPFAEDARCPNNQATDDNPKPLDWVGALIESG